jgi:PAS domain S-box-containing protein
MSLRHLLRTTAGRLLLGTVPVLAYAWVVYENPFLSGLTQRFPFFMMFPPVLLSSAAGGLLAGGLSTLIGTLLLRAHWIEDHLWLDEAVEVAFLTFGFAIAWTHGHLHRRSDALRESERRLSLALRAGESGTFDWDLRTGLIVWSDEMLALYGLTPGEFGGRYDEWVECVVTDDLDRINADLQRSVTTGDPLETEFCIRRRDCGALRWMHARGQVLRDAEGQPARLVGINVDVTARRQAEAEREAVLGQNLLLLREAEAANRTKDEFLAVLSHELRTPLNVVIGYTRMLRHARSGADRERMIGVIERNAAAQLRLIEDLLDVQRIVSGRLSIERQPFMLDSVAGSVLDSFGPQVAAKGLHFRAVLEPIQVHGDPARLQQVLWNLLSNAIKFTPREGCVGLLMRRDGGWAEILVQDSGEGIPLHFLPHVFERFRQLDQSATRRHFGMGLGLAIAKEVVEQHGGTIHAESEGAGRGATFVVRLPCESAAMASEDRARARLESLETDRVDTRAPVGSVHVFVPAAARAGDR